jgi:hypothetical protein
LATKFDFARTFLSHPVHEFLSRFVKPFDDLKENDIIGSHHIPLS